MKTNKIENIKALIEKFFDGDTTAQEEEMLYSFFNSKRVPKELEKYRETLTAFGLISRKAATAHVRHTRMWRIVASAAAAVMLLFGVVAYLNFHEEQVLAANYGGSYVIVNGHRTDDLKAIKKDIKTALNDAKSIEHHAENNTTVDKAEQEVLDNIDDPQMKREVMQMLN